ncbi:MAG: CAP domain-containing protein [Planctomycetota bacterium]|nr:MAG: CAP domain-containing protein [Planctomycetota bacterium]
MYCLELTNAERQKEGVQPLEWEPYVAEIAKWFAQDKNDNDPQHMQKHYDSLGRLLNVRFADFGFTNYQTCGENIDWGVGSGTAGAEKAMSEWMASSGHRMNILKAEYTHIGIGEVNGHWVQDFIKR